MKLSKPRFEPENRVRTLNTTQHEAFQVSWHWLLITDTMVAIKQISTNNHIKYFTLYFVTFDILFLDFHKQN